MMAASTLFQTSASRYCCGNDQLQCWIALHASSKFGASAMRQAFARTSVCSSGLASGSCMSAMKQELLLITYNWPRMASSTHHGPGVYFVCFVFVCFTFFTVFMRPSFLPQARVLCLNRSYGWPVHRQLQLKRPARH